MIFDGTTHVDKAVAGVVCFVTSEFQIQQCLVQLQLSAKNLNGQELACVLISTLSTKLSVDSHNLVATMCDRASVNNVAMETLCCLPQNSRCGMFFSYFRSC